MDIFCVSPQELARQKNANGLIMLIIVVFGVAVVLSWLEASMLTLQNSSPILLLRVLVPMLGLALLISGFLVWNRRKRLQRLHNLRLVVSEDNLVRSNGAWAEEICFDEVSKHVVLRDSSEVVSQIVVAKGKTYDLSNLERQSELADLLSARITEKLIEPQLRVKTWMKIVVALGTVMLSIILFFWSQNRGLNQLLSEGVLGPTMLILGVGWFFVPGVSNGVTKRDLNQQLMGWTLSLLGVIRVLGFF